MGLDVVDRGVGNETQVRRPGFRHSRIRLEFLAFLVEVDLLPTESQSLAGLRPERHHLHAENILVECAGGIDIRHGEDDVIQSV